MSGNGHLRAARATEARRLYDAGWHYLDACEHMGISKPYYYELLNDPEGLRVRARKDSYRGTCKTCGAPTDGSNGAASAPDECTECHRKRQHDERHWTADRIIAAIREWTRRYGRQPSAQSWQGSTAYGFDPDRYYSGVAGVPEWPATNTVLREFGSWNTAIRAAGFEPLHEFSTPYRDDPAILDEMARLYRDGLACGEIAERYGLSTTRVYQLLDKAGEPRRSRSEAGRLRWACERAVV